ncbi:Na/Pi symporter [Roseivirga pacifica]|uniref:Na/Pi symporter n=1 Tax=Roseivirga pacifica TaxID=1267423 RepID=UPI0020950DE0|nr:Na/Pi symporter [Roseivirga pacifica]MCO6359698.1 Na/Pi cotransporter family protein [Roseivirga pacifica]MCO6367068.1 Na/Pi cotransporter family protein [Roseivirga pacifica]MCO6370400.1 Na/Pi cotransporter family protein [Roseivirga pacifica]MCO6374725.1 Na/Pi cotransporter family protein [Roseivirga pacifica]MCO6379983.1 Na/Pi cotransporter family protein [Roseivirga pacifica]
MKLIAGDKDKRTSVAIRVVYISLVLTFFLFCIKFMVLSLGEFAGYFQENILSSSLDPFIGLFIGLLITAIIQSSSTTSTMVVGMVAAGALTLGEAIPVIMGANIGTTLTSTIVAFGFVSDRVAFRKALAAGVIHDFYNILLVVILFPLEYYYGFLSGLCESLQAYLFGSGAFDADAKWDWVFDFGVTEQIAGFINNSIIQLLLSLVLVFLSIKLLTSIIQKTVIGKSKDKLRTYIFDKPGKSFGWGVLITAAIQSSSVSTSLLVPLVATGKVRLNAAFPFIIGANLGTTITALIAASFSSTTAMSIAIAHLLINLSGVFIFMFSGVLRNGMVNFTKRFSFMISQRRLIGLVYILVTFFLLPFILISFHKQGGSNNEKATEPQEISLLAQEAKK